MDLGCRARFATAGVHENRTDPRHVSASPAMSHVQSYGHFMCSHTQGGELSLPLLPNFQQKCPAPLVCWYVPRGMSVENRDPLRK
jgi:hypothetical protein